MFFQIDVRREEALIQGKKREMGWQVYATNAAGMALACVVWAYRGQYRIEDDWSRLKGRPLGLVPMYLQDEQRMQGLVYLLSLALRLLSLLEWVVRERLGEDGAKRQGVYAGQPGRKTDRPSAELLLGAMKTISVSGACRHYVKDRMERSGMRWSIEGAQAMLDVRSEYLNGDWEAFHSFRIEHETQRLYPHRDVLQTIEWPLAL